MTIYTTRYCAFCRAAKHLLEKRGLLFQEIPVDGDREARARLLKETGRRTVPIIFIGDTAIGGFMELAALDESGELDERLSV